MKEFNFQGKSIDKLREFVKISLSEKRYIHTLAVEKETRYLASHLCPEKAEELARAALLHDITKYLTPEEHAEIIPDLTEDDKKSPSTLHAKTGGEVARRNGENMWSAIASHTTGKPAMSVYEMIIFVADYIEETREHSACISERKRLHEEFEKAKSLEEKTEHLSSAVCRILQKTVVYLTKKEVFIHPRTLDALKYYMASKE